MVMLLQDVVESVGDETTVVAELVAFVPQPPSVSAMMVAAGSGIDQLARRWRCRSRTRSRKIG